MTKKPKPKPLGYWDEVDLRRWCIEQAVRWPVEPARYPGIASAGGYAPPTEHDVIGRAKKIHEWVKAV
jgi:hypothetical protein